MKSSENSRPTPYPHVGTGHRSRFGSRNYGSDESQMQQSLGVHASSVPSPPATAI